MNLSNVFLLTLQTLNNKYREDRHSYIHNLCSCEKEGSTQFRLSGIGTLASAIPVQRSNQLQTPLPKLLSLKIKS